MRMSFVKTILISIVVFSVFYLATDVIIHRVFYRDQIWRALEAGASGGTVTAWLQTRRKHADNRKKG